MVNISVRESVVMAIVHPVNRCAINFWVVRTISVTADVIEVDVTHAQRLWIFSVSVKLLRLLCLVEERKSQNLHDVTIHADGHLTVIMLQGRLTDVILGNVHPANNSV